MIVMKTKRKTMNNKQSIDRFFFGVSIVKVTSAPNFEIHQD